MCAAQAGVALVLNLVRQVREISKWTIVLAGLPMLGAALAADVDPLESYHSNSLACLDNVTKATCYIWIGSVWRDGDRSYLVMWDRGPQTEMPTVGGNFRIEGREGTYRLKAGQLCLTPLRNDHKRYAMAEQGELYAGSGCYEIAAHNVGEKWTQTDARGRTVTFWLLKGR
jgi:hypothetical protein